jgi:hypothetical protein
MRAVVFHKAKAADGPQLLAHGLQYGRQGPLSREGPVAQANAYLDRHIPAACAGAGISRQQCIYAYLYKEGCLFGIKSGSPIKPEDWDPGQGFIRLCLQVDAAGGYVSDLDTFDRVAEALQKKLPDNELQQRAAAYWAALIPLTTVLTKFAAGRDGVTGPDGQRIARPEVMLTDSVPPANMAQF